jgi:hypothetical protein
MEAWRRGVSQTPVDPNGFNRMPSRLRTFRLHQFERRDEPLDPNASKNSSLRHITAHLPFHLSTPNNTTHLLLYFSPPISTLTTTVFPPPYYLHLSPPVTDPSTPCQPLRIQYPSIPITRPPPLHSNIPHFPLPLATASTSIPESRSSPVRLRLRLRHSFSSPALGSASSASP